MARVYHLVVIPKWVNNFPSRFIKCDNVPDCGFESTQVGGWSRHGDVMACCVKCVRELTERLGLDPEMWVHTERFLKG